MPKRYPEEFRRKVLDLVAAGRPIAQIAADLGISDQTIYSWRKQELIDTGQLPGLNRAEQAELAAANKRIRELENEVAILKRGHGAIQRLILAAVEHGDVHPLLYIAHLHEYDVGRLSVSSRCRGHCHCSTAVARSS